MTVITYDNVPSIDISNVKFIDINMNNKVEAAGFYSDFEDNDDNGYLSNDEYTNAQKEKNKHDQLLEAKDKIKNSEKLKNCFSCKKNTNSKFKFIKEVTGESDKITYFIMTECQDCHNLKSTKISKPNALVLADDGAQIKKTIKKGKKKRIKKEQEAK